MGAIVTLELPADSPMITMPWIITFGPLGDDEEWEPVVCGPYERPHALALADSVVADDEVMAVVEPLLPHASVAEIRAGIAAAKLASEDEEDLTARYAAVADMVDDEMAEEAADSHGSERRSEVGPPPDPAEVREGFARIAKRLTTVKL